MVNQRKPLQGVGNIIRFNWHFYAIAFAILIAGFLIGFQFNFALRAAILLSLIVVVIVITASLIASTYVYDLSGFYRLKWLSELKTDRTIATIVNIHAGFDETSNLLSRRYPAAELHIFDFYNPAQHTEISIERARKAYPPHAKSVHVSTDHLPLADAGVDVVFGILSLHEIRDDTERIACFKELSRILKSDGEILVVEHVRDVANLLAYNLGAFHFHSMKTWHHTFKNTDLTLVKSFKINPLITAFILCKNGSTP